MAFAIGNYIHFSNENYKKFGTAREEPVKGDQAYSSYKKVFETQKNQIKINSQSKSNIKGLEDFLNSLIYPTKGKNENQIEQSAFAEFQKMVQLAFQEKWRGFSIDMKDLHVYQNKISKSTTEISVSSLQSYANQLNTIIKNLGNGKEVEQEVGQIKDTIKKIEQAVKLNNPDAMIKLDTEKGQSLISDINYALSIASFNYKMLGDAFEIWLAGVAEIANYNAETITSDIVKKVCKDLNKKVSGGDVAQSKVNLNKLSATYTNKEEIKDVFKENKWSISENVNVLTKASQQKTDIVFNWKGTPLNISAKNYSLKDNNSVIHLLSGTSLLQILLTTSGNYANHFLNMVASTPEDSNAQEARNSLKIIILAKALTGQDLKDIGLADTFVLNARSKKHIYVFTMKQLFKAYSQNPNLIHLGNSLDITQSRVGGPDSIESANIRITKLIASLHTKKLAVSINPSEIIGKQKS